MRKIRFRADASAQIGFGHFIRTLALADMLKDDFDCVFYTAEPSSYQIGEIQKVCSYVPLSEKTKFEDFVAMLDGSEIVVLDNYFFTTDYQRAIKAKGCKLVCIDDMHNKHYVADAVVNHGLTDPMLFDKEPYTKLYLGFDYALLRKPFLQPAKKEKKKNHWFVSFGGSDYNNLTGKFLSYLENNESVESVTVVIGDAFSRKEILNSYKKATILKNLSANRMRDEMTDAEYAVLPSSSVCIEAISCGCKIASGYYVDNQQEFYNHISSELFIYPLGDLNEWKGDSFIEGVNQFEFKTQDDFSTISVRYKQLFKEL